jgi:regulatory protein YycH of two-component signal transduction system YycFG
MTFLPVLAVLVLFVLVLALAGWKITSDFKNIRLENLDQKQKKSEVQKTANDFKPLEHMLG